MKKQQHTRMCIKKFKEKKKLTNKADSHTSRREK
jgi:hypothetical protein